ncbi:UPF0481 protein At3g47200-like [Typha latifolia]|uniref:UPF0481 protein At3g47200-like n=1 Tax=Typha latifolia TaxID=4733 RepID=UPI003C303218
MDASSEPSACDDICGTTAESSGAVAAAEIENAEDAASVIDVEALASEMASALVSLRETDPYTITRVPTYVRERNKKLYEPMVIAIGPYHHGREHLQDMEKHKWRFLRDLLSRSTTEASLEVLLGKMKAWEKEARRCYSESIGLTSKEFVKMMLLDGCFIIEFFWKCQEGDLDNNKFSGIQYILLDVLLLENQIPFFIIDGLFELVVGSAAESRETPSLVEHIRPIYLAISGVRMKSQTVSPPAKIHHLLHLYYHWVVPAAMNPSWSDHHSPTLERLISQLFSSFPPMKSEKPTSFIPSATELREAGVTFRKKASPDHMLDITFRNGVMEIPLNHIEDSTRTILTNLVAFEQSMLDGPMNITSFSLLMDSLINTEKDVAILQRCDVVDHFLGSEEEVARFFNQLCEHAVIDLTDHYFSELFSEVNFYRDSKWHSYRARLVHDYFSNPWAILSLVAALILLALTFLQTFFAIYSYFRPPN